MTRYRVVSHPDLRILRFGDEAVVFNPLLWHTHLLNAAASLLLDELAAAPANADELAAAITDEAGEPVIPAAQVAETLESLAGLRLIEPVPGVGAP